MEQRLESGRLGRGLGVRASKPVALAAHGTERVDRRSSLGSGDVALVRGEVALMPRGVTLPPRPGELLPQLAHLGVDGLRRSPKLIRRSPELIHICCWLLYLASFKCGAVALPLVI